MRTTKRFDLALSALVGAFFNNTLAKGVCTACAIGNIVAKANNVKIRGINHDGSIIAHGAAELAAKGAAIFNERVTNASWAALFLTDETGKQKRAFEETGDDRSPRELLNIGYFVIASTGYSADELAQVEHAFERSTKINYQDYLLRSEEEIKEDQYQGLKAVVDVLCSLDGMSQEETELYASAFDYEKPEFTPAHAELVDQILVEA